MKTYLILDAENFKEEDHPFPNKELALIMKMNRDGVEPIEDIAVFSHLIGKYLDLRNSIFRKDPISGIVDDN